MKAFERKFGVEYLDSVPNSPGIYFFYDEAGELLYVGKAKNLKKRLTQYRDAVRKRRGKKPRRIVKDAVRVEWQICASDYEACLLEMREIQKRRPRHNLVGAYSFLYPLIGLRFEDSQLALCLTTLPEKFVGFQFYGAYRSRELTGEAFFSLIRLLDYVGHRERAGAKGRAAVPEYSYLFQFRRFPTELMPLWDRFFRGLSSEALEELVIRLLDKPGARNKATELQEDFDNLRRFWRKEAKVLAEALAKTGYAQYPVPQAERDPLFISFRNALASPACEN